MLCYLIKCRRHSAGWPVAFDIRAILAIFIFASGSSVAAPQSPTGVAPKTTADTSHLSLTEALRRTLQASPQLQQQPLALRQQALLRLQAAATPVPELTLSAENITGSSQQSRGFNQGEYSVGWSQLLESDTKRQSRLAVNTASQNLLHYQQQQQQLTVMAQTVRAYQQLQSLQLLARWTEHRRQTESNIVSIAKQRQAAALILPAEVSRLQLRLLQTELQQQQLQAATLQAAAELAALWGASADFTQVDALPKALPVLPDWPVLQQQLQQSPQWHSWLSAERLAQAETQLAQVNQQNDWQLGVGLTRNQAQQDTSLQLTLSRPLGIKEPQQLALSQLQTEQQQLSQRLDAQQLQLRLQWHYQQLQQQAQQIHQLQQQVLPQAELLVSQSQQAWQQGVLSTADWLSARQELLQSELMLIELRVAFANRLLELQLLTGDNLLASNAEQFAPNAGRSHYYRSLPASMQPKASQTSSLSREQLPPVVGKQS